MIRDVDGKVNNAVEYRPEVVDDGAASTGRRPRRSSSLLQILFLTVFGSRDNLQMHDIN